jgi:two-component system cell cycle sensor histidine kinase PleC
MARVGADDRSVEARLVPHPEGVLATWSAVAVAPDRLAAERRRADLAESRLLDSVVASPNPFALFDSEDRLAVCNDAWIDVFALRGVDRLIGERFLDLMARVGRPRGDTADTIDAYVAWRRSGRDAAVDTTFELTRPDGRVFRMREWRTRDGGAVTQGFELTELIDQRQVLRRAVELLECKVALFDPNDRLVVWNRTYASLVGPDFVREGLSYDDLCRYSAEPSQLVSLADGRRVDAETRIARHRKRPKRVDYERWYDDGSVTRVYEVCAPDGWSIVSGMRVDDVEPKEALLRSQVRELDAARSDAERHGSELAAVTRQLTREKERAETANRTKSRFLANMSHELRTPLNAILGFSEVLKLESFGPLGYPRYQEYAEDIHASGTHLLSLINDILDMSKVEAGKYRLDLEEVQLVSVVDAAVRMVRGRAAEADLHLAVARVDPSLRLTIDTRAIRQVLMNLLVNSIKFTQPGGFVDLDCIVEEDAVLLVVRDTGCGIDPKDVPRLLRPFEQAHEDELRRRQGTGLGLPLSSALVTLHDGALTVEGAVGVGTSVTVRLPRR